MSGDIANSRENWSGGGPTARTSLADATTRADATMTARRSMRTQIDIGASEVGRAEAGPHQATRNLVGQSRGAGRPAAAAAMANPYGSANRVEPRQVASDDQRMHVVRAFVRIHGLEIQHVADHRILVDDAVRAETVAREPRDVQRLAHVVALCE